MTRELIAKDSAFYRGVLLRRGERFAFHGSKAPKWAAEVSEKLPPAPAELRVDTKPPAATKAAKIKASGAADQVV